MQIIWRNQESPRLPWLALQYMESPLGNVGNSLKVILIFFYKNKIKN